MQDHGSGVSDAGKIMFHTADFSDGHRGEEKTTETNNEGKKKSPFQSAAI